MPEQNGRLIALLVGINAYQPPVSPLDGCVNDVMNMARFLEQQPGFSDIQILELTDRFATKSEIVKQMREHLGQAQAGDVAFMYYSGHGAREAADTSIWRFESDKKLEGLVCFDSIPMQPPYDLLVDKELRYLIHEIAHGTSQHPKAAPPHVITVFDCCHSGDNTRNIYIKAEPEAPKERQFKPTARMSTVLPMRDWNTFIFANDDLKEQLKKKPLGQVLPEGQHIQLAACAHDESSFEVDGSGIFTKNLIEVLNRSQGGISYYNLRNRLHYYIKNQYKQQPQIFAGGEDKSIVHRHFLDRNVPDRPLMGNLIKTPNSGWVLDMGAIHGISRQATTVNVFEEDNPSETWSGMIMEVTPDKTYLSFPPGTAAKMEDPDKRFYAHVADFLSAPIQVFLENQEDDPQIVDKIKALIRESGKNISVTDKKAAADYLLRLMEGRPFIVQAEDPWRPVINPVRGYTESALNQLISDLRHIAQWEYVHQLHNSGPNRLPEDAVGVQFWKVTKQGDVPLTIQDDAVQLEYEKSSDPTVEYTASVRIKLTNQAGYPVHVALLYLSSTFAVNAGLLTNKVQKLEPGESVFVFEGDEVELTYEKATKYFNKPESTTLIKLLASRVEFNVIEMEQDDLDDPAKLAEAQRSVYSKGLRRKSTNVAADAWGTRLLTLHMPNPNYNKLDQQTIDKLLQSEAGTFIQQLV